MLTLVVVCKGDQAEAAARTLGSAVEGALAGLVAEAVLTGGGPALDRVAEAAGARLLPEAAFLARLGEARGDHLLVLEAGARLEPGWPEAVRAALAAGPVRAARFRPAGARPLASWFRRPRALARGLLVARQAALPLARNARSFEELARGLATRALPARLAPAGG